MSLSSFNLGGYFDFTGGIHLESLLIICKALIDVRRRPACLVTSQHSPETACECLAVARPKRKDTKKGNLNK